MINGNTFVLDEGRFNDFLQSAPLTNFYYILNIHHWNVIDRKDIELVYKVEAIYIIYIYLIKFNFDSNILYFT